ncbi:MAG: GNAT family N-acetyltransferase, partial [Planctomycetaceae bacterium]
SRRGASRHNPLPLYRVVELPRGAASRELLDLAIVAGGHSRFQLDPRILADKFRGLYETWMNRSTLLELADVVLVATPPDASDDFVGMITLSETAGAGQIGLLAVRDDHRGRGVATLLLTVAHDWLRHRGATELSVVTQLENREACGLYSRWGCEIAEVRRWFHFWVQEVG